MEAQAKVPCYRTESNDYKGEYHKRIDIGVKDSKGRVVGFVVSIREYNQVPTDITGYTAFYQKDYHLYTKDSPEWTPDMPVSHYFKHDPTSEYSFVGTTLHDVVPGHYYSVSAISARNGIAYGSASMDVVGTDLNDVMTKINLKIKKATKLALKKWNPSLLMVCEYYGVA
jgi:hypothetical protein